jgi:hypothetical protein
MACVMASLWQQSCRSKRLILVAGESYDFPAFSQSKAPLRSQGRIRSEFVLTTQPESLRLR